MPLSSTMVNLPGSSTGTYVNVYFLNLAFRKHFSTNFHPTSQFLSLPCWFLFNSLTFRCQSTLSFSRGFLFIPVGYGDFIPCHGLNTIYLSSCPKFLSPASASSLDIEVIDTTTRRWSTGVVVLDNSYWHLIDLHHLVWNDTPDLPPSH